MSTLFVGRLRGKGDKLLAASPQIAAGFQQAGDALRTYEADRQAQQKESMLKASIVAKMYGGWGSSPQDVKNSLPRIFGMDFPTDTEGNVQVPQTWEEKLNQYKIDTFGNDPEKMQEIALIDSGYMEKMLNPDRLELETNKAAAEVAKEQRKESAWYEHRDYEKRIGDINAARDYNNSLRLAQAKAAMKPYGKGKQGDKGTNPSGIYFDDSTGKMMNAHQLAQAYPDQTPDSVRMMSNDEFKNESKRVDDISMREGRAALAGQRSTATQLAMQTLERLMAENQAAAGLKKAIQEGIRAGQNTKSEEMQLQQILLQELKDDNPSMTDDQARQAVQDSWVVWGEDSSREKLFEATARRKARVDQQGAGSPLSDGTQVTPGGTKYRVVQ